MRAQTGDRAARAVVGDTAMLVDGADCDRAGRATGRADRARPRAGVAGRDADEDSLSAQRVDLARQGIARIAGAAKREVHHFDLEPAEPRERGQNGVLVPPCRERALAITSDAFGATPR